MPDILETWRGSRVVNYASEIDEKALGQAQALARLPFVWPHVALMPDAHVGKGSSVGTVIPTQGAIIPAAVGVDIGCGMIAAETNYTLTDLQQYADTYTKLREMLEDAIPLSPGNYNDNVRRFPWTLDRVQRLHDAAVDKGIDLNHSRNWREQLGTLGGGNHFIELCVDERDHIWLTLHSGSRGVGNKIAQKHIKTAQHLCKTWFIELADQDHAYLPMGTPEFTAYLRELNWAQQFALENRSEMMHRFMWCFYRWMGGPNDPEKLDAFVQTHIVDVVNCHHNYTRMERHMGRDVWVTRKGAIDAHEGNRAMIPGSMGTRSYIVKGRGSKLGLCSAPHGAGRRFSRNEAKAKFSEDDLRREMGDIVYNHSAALIDEIPSAYKDIDQVMADAADLVEVEHTLRQLVNVKGTK